jgi:hypothetical protein
MITVKSSVQVSGKWIKFCVEDGQVKGLEYKPVPALPNVTIPAVLEAIEEVRDELTQAIESLRGCFDDKRIKQLTFEPADLQTVFKSIAASNSNEARAIAYRLFYADPANGELVLHVKSCPPIGDLPDGKREYDVLGFTRPRQKKLKGTLAPVVEKKEEAPA